MSKDSVNQSEIKKLINLLASKIDEIKDIDDKIDTLNSVRGVLHNVSPLKHNPVDFIYWEKVDNMQANDYNPNHVAKREMDLLYQSIKCDGFTMPVVTFPIENSETKEIVDGFHRYTTSIRYKNISKRDHGRLPISMISKDKSDRMASTIRHNRARGKHEVELQAALVGMLKKGWDELKIMKELGMTLEEVQRLIGLKGIASEIKGIPYSIERQIIEAGEDIKPEDE
ncbi:IbrB-like domain-containing protein [Riemerella anatipestifer]|uniref:IbrB-like domain-containing protein n=1 Tax=Riemerella anatipestifer TaxID=34085 RepID=UPI0030EBEAAD